MFAIIITCFKSLEAVKTTRDSLKATEVRQSEKVLPAPMLDVFFPGDFAIFTKQMLSFWDRS